MSPDGYVIAFDVGTTSAKSCLYRLGDTLELVSRAGFGYPITMLPGGGAEQDPEDWWSAVARGSRATLAAAGVAPASVRGMAFCCQMQSLVLVDGEGVPVRPAMSYMDQRGAAELDAVLGRGLRVEGMEITRLLSSLSIAGGVSASAKDPVWKYRWVRRHEPEAFARARAWLDVKEYLVLRATGRAAMTADSANATFMYDTRAGRQGWSGQLCSMFGVDPSHLPPVMGASERAGGLGTEAASDLGLEPGTPVFGGGGDLSLIALGSGACGLGDVHAYMGTSGWVAASVGRRSVDTATRSAAVMGAIPGRYNYISEQETSGKCMEWVRDHLARDEIGVYLGGGPEVAGTAGSPDRAEDDRLFAMLDETVSAVPAGAGGVVFAPWLHGSRSPFEDPWARGMFFNIGLGNGKRDLVRAVAEGMALQCRWQYEAVSRMASRGRPLRFVGGVARSRAMARLLADVTGLTVEVPAEPQNAGALGAALTAAAGLGALSSLEEAARLVPVAATHGPDPERKALWDGRLSLLKDLYRANRRLFKRMNRTVA